MRSVFSSQNEAYILEIIHSVGKEFEILPGRYFNKVKEELRDHFLLYLAPRFRNEGSVTGETFSKVGKNPKEGRQRI